jgi:hypothetical protein
MFYRMSDGGDKPLPRTSSRPGQPPHYLRRGAQARLDAETAGDEAKEMIALGVG